MTTQLAIGYLAAGRRLPRGAGVSPRSAHVTERDSIDARPDIPRTVISWTDADALDVRLPAGAGDPATDVSGPPPFSAYRPPRPLAAWRRDRLDGALFGALGVLLFVLAAAVAWQLDQPSETWISRDENPSPMALIGRIPVVELRVLGFEPLATPRDGTAPAVASLAGKAKAAAN